MKNKAAQSLGRKGGKARIKTMTPEQRSDIARKAAQKRWGERPGPEPMKKPRICEHEEQDLFGLITDEAMHCKVLNTSTLTSRVAHYLNTKKPCAKCSKKKKK